MALSRKQLNDLLRRLEGPLRRDFAVAIQSARGRAKITALVRAIELGDLDTIMIAAGVRDGMWSTLTESIRNIYAVSGKATVEGDVPKTYGMEFDINNPRAQGWLTKNSSGLIWGKAVGGGLRPEQRAAVQTMLTNGMLKGNNPRTTALDIVGRIDKTGKRTGGILGLTENQAQWVVNMGDDLQDLNWSRYKSRVLRDKRWDKVVKKSMQEGRVLPQAQRNKIVQSYENRMTKYRGDTIARTETLQALNAASDEALRQVVDEGLAPANAVTRIWRHSFAGNERPGHLAMSGQPRGIEEPFTNPITGAILQHPGAGPASEVINCRCFVEHKIDFVAVERAGVDPDQFRPAPPPPPPPTGLAPVAAAQAAVAAATPAAAEVTVTTATGAGQFGGLMPASTPGPAYNTGKTWRVLDDARHINSPDAAAEWVRKGGIDTGNEHGVFLTKNNRLLDARVGGEDHIGYDKIHFWKDELKDGSYFHSHPSSSALSPADLSVGIEHQLKNMTAIGTDSKNYFLATDFKTAKGGDWLTSGASIMGRATEKAGNKLWGEMSLNARRLGIREELQKINALYKEGGHFANREAYTKALKGIYVELNNSVIAESILTNQLIAKYAGHTFKYALEPGAHSAEIRRIMRELIDSGWIRELEAKNQSILNALRDLIDE